MKEASMKRVNLKSINFKLTRFRKERNSIQIPFSDMFFSTIFRLKTVENYLPDTVIKNLKRVFYCLHDKNDLYKMHCLRHNIIPWTICYRLDKLKYNNPCLALFLFRTKFRIISVWQFSSLN